MSIGQHQERAERLFAERDLKYVFEQLTSDLLSMQEYVNDNDVAVGIQMALDRIIEIQS